MGGVGLEALYGFNLCCFIGSIWGLIQDTKANPGVGSWQEFMRLLFVSLPTRASGSEYPTCISLPQNLYYSSYHPNLKSSFIGY